MLLLMLAPPSSHPRLTLLRTTTLLASTVARPGGVNGSTLRHMPNGGNGDATIGVAYALWTERLAVLVHRHRWAEAGGAECERIKLRTAALPSSAPHRGN